MGHYDDCREDEYAEARRLRREDRLRRSRDAARLMMQARDVLLLGAPGGRPDFTDKIVDDLSVAIGLLVPQAVEKT